MLNTQPSAQRQTSVAPNTKRRKTDDNDYSRSGRDRERGGASSQRIHPLQHSQAVDMRSLTFDSISLSKCIFCDCASYVRVETKWLDETGWTWTFEDEMYLS